MQPQETKTVRDIVTLLASKDIAATILGRACGNWWVRYRGVRMTLTACLNQAKLSG